jgi:DnaJ domain
MRTSDRLSQFCDAATANAAGANERLCEWGGCDQHGLYRAPRSRTQLTLYWWFCLHHVRAYNAAWNYYAGMTDLEVEADVRRDTVWQRPSWPLGVAMRFHAWQARGPSDGFGMFGEDEPARPRAPETAEEKALMLLDLQPPVTIAILKARYKELVKQHHPDANGGDKGAEERFKQISEAYRTVMNSLAR